MGSGGAVPNKTLTRLAILSTGTQQNLTTRVSQPSSVNEGIGKAFYRKDNSVKRSGPFSEPQDSEKRTFSTVSKLVVHCKRRGSEKCTFLGVFDFLRTACSLKIPLKNL